MTDELKDSSTETVNHDEVESLKHDNTLWANKFKNPYQLEKAYGESVKVYNEYKEFKSKVESQSKVPDEYKVPEGLELDHDDIVELKRLSKDANLSQTHFDNLTQRMSEKAKDAKANWEKRKSEIGEEKINLIADYVKKNYPEQLYDTLVNKIIEDDKLMSDAFKHRDALLNTKRAGINAGSAGESKPYDGQKELKELILEQEKTKNPKLKEKIINLAREIGHERFKNKAS